MQTIVKLFGGDADADHSQIIGGMQSNYWGDISPRGFGTPIHVDQSVNLSSDTTKS